ncbi:MAG: MerR family transcriptional regulator [Lachnospiraceae bacterium]|nr:MerR family transcriptional regulator [Lachnospiraceae bacterium]
MKIKEVEQRLGVDRANIRYYEREGLLLPARGENRYRDYSEEDVARLKTVVILRKLGVSVAEIREVLDGRQSMTETLAENEEHLKQQLEELNGALAMCRRLEQKKVELDTFDQDYYWEEMHREEQAGSGFLDICKDYLAFEKGVVNHVFWDGEDMARQAGWTGWKAVVFPLLMVLAVLVAVGAEAMLLGDTFLEGFLMPLKVLLLLSILALPEFLLRRKFPKAAQLWKKGVTILAFAVGALLIVWVVVMLFNDRLHFLF